MNSIIEYKFIKNDDIKKPNEVIITLHPIKENNIFVIEYNNKKYTNINKFMADTVKKII